MLQNHPLKILVLSTFDSRNANVIRDFLFSFNGYSIHDYYYIFDCRILDEHTDFSIFDVILVFWSLYLPGLELSEEAQDKIRQSRALKVLFLQDEYRDVRLFNQIMSQLGVQVMFTCVAEKDHEVFYPQRLIPSLQATYTVLPGYVPAYLEAYQFAPQNSRPLDISYRSRIVPYYLGDLGQEKKIIANRFQEIARTHGFKSDISVQEQDRIYGNRWIRFMKSSRIVLGTPSGASVIDFTGEIRRNCEDYLILHPEATYEEVKQKIFAEEDWKVVIDTVSPRIFEAAALGCTMVMHEGYYAGILQPGKHYIAVRKDYSNINEVVDQMRDKNYCRQLAQQAHRELVASGEYSYRTFIQRFDQILSRHVNQPIAVHSFSKAAFYARNYLKYGETIIPNRHQFYVLPFGKIIRGLKRANAILRKFFDIISISELRQILFLYLLKRKWLSLQPNLVLANLAKLALLIHLQSQEIKTSLFFSVEVKFEPVLGSLSFKFYRAQENSAGFSVHLAFPIALLEAAFKQGKLRIVEWDCSLLEYQVYVSNRKYSFHFGVLDNSEVIPIFAHDFPTQTWAALLRALGLV